MKRISQRTLVRMMGVMSRMHRAAAPPRRRGYYVLAGVAEETFWRRLLLEHDFPPSFVEKAQQEYGFSWDTILLRLRDGTFLQRYDPLSALESDGVAPPTLEEARVSGELFVQGLAALLAKHPYGEPVLRSLQLAAFQSTRKSSNWCHLRGLSTNKRRGTRSLSLFALLDFLGRL